MNILEPKTSVKVVGANGQILLGKEFAGLLVLVEEREPGDVIVMGTPAGVGHARKPPVWMKQGDTIEIEGIGVLSNPIRDEGRAI